MKSDRLWDEHFSKHEEPPEAVRAAVRRLLAAARRQRSVEARREAFQHVTAMLRAAIRHHQAQPWMYEGLVLSLQGSAAAPEEIEGTLREAAELAGADNPDVLMHVAAWLSRLERYDAAIALYRDAARADPTRAEPYVNAMHLAVPLDDLETLQWAVTGVFEHCAQDEALCRRARQLGAAMVERLKLRNRADEAHALSEALATVEQADLLVRLSWVGEADLDLVVEEPGGSVCSWQRPQTEAGGMHLGDAFGTRRSETYVCRRGFSGEYRIQVHRVWGQPVAKRVVLEVLQRAGSPDQHRSKRVLPIGQEGLTELVELDAGRRTELAVVDEANHPRVDPRQHRRRVLAQLQQQGMIRPQIGAISSTTGRPFVTGVRPVVGRGAIGFQPVIQVIPSGASFVTQGVISADRRYVRLSPVPIFTQLAEVFTFTTNLGAVSGGGLFGGGFGGGGGGGLGF